MTSIADADAVDMEGDDKKKEKDPEDTEELINKVKKSAKKVKKIKEDPINFDFKRAKKDKKL